MRVSLHMSCKLNFFFNYFFYLPPIVGGGAQTGSTRYVGHLLAYCTCPGWLWGWRIRCNEWQGKPKYSEKTYPGATLSTTNPTWPDLGLNPGRRDGKPATNCFSCGAACLVNLVIIWFGYTWHKLVKNHFIKLYCFSVLLCVKHRRGCNSRMNATDVIM
jgi:hypothetical protein